MGFDINSKHSAKATTTVQRLVRDGFIALALTLTVVTPSVGQTADELRAMAQAQLGALEPVTEREVASPAVDLGRKLFWDSRLSSDGNTACASCHYQQAWGSDSRQRSMTARGEPTGMHSMTVFNTQVAAAGLRWFGDRPSGAAQAIGSITGSMGFESREDILPVMAEHGYEEGFQQAFPDDSDYFSVDNYGEALEAYQRALRTPAPFDAWLNGDDSAMSDKQSQGLRRFLTLGCGSCHNGVLLGGGSLQRFGTLADYWEHTGVQDPHPGLMASTGREEDRYRFRVPSLRNVAKTPPYFHDGSVDQLESAVNIMATIQLGQTLDDESLDELGAFLEALTGDIPAYFSPPEGVPFELPEGVKQAPFGRSGG